MGSKDIALSSMGDLTLLDKSLIGIFASVKCPGRLILKVHEEAKRISTRNQAVVGGFQSPVEKKMLAVLMQGTSPIVICPARGLNGMRIPKAWIQKIEAGQLLVLSHFPSHIKRPHPESILKRNQLVTHLASELLVIHAEAGGKIEFLALDALSSGKQVWVLDERSTLRNMGAEVFTNE